MTKTNMIAPQDYTVFSIHPTSDGIPSLDANPVSKLRRPRETVRNYIRRTLGTKYLTEQIFATKEGSFWQIYQAHMPEDTQHDMNRRIALYSGNVYTVTTGPTWLIPMEKTGLPKLLDEQQIKMIKKSIRENMKSSMEFLRANPDDDNVVHFTQEFYIPIREDEFVEFKPCGEELSSRLWVISQMLIEANEVRLCAKKMLLILAAFFQSSSDVPSNLLHKCADVVEVRQKYTKQKAGRMFYDVMNAMLATVVAFARVAVEISCADTSNPDNPERFLDCENWEIMIDHAIRSGDARTVFVANQFQSHIEDAECICAAIMKLSEMVGVYQGINEVIKPIVPEENDKYLLAPHDDKKSLHTLITRARKNLDKVAKIEEKIKSDIRVSDEMVDRIG